VIRHGDRSLGSDRCESGRARRSQPAHRPLTTRPSQRAADRNHGHATSHWSWPQQCHIAVVRPGREARRPPREPAAKRPQLQGFPWFLAPLSACRTWSNTRSSY